MCKINYWESQDSIMRERICFEVELLVNVYHEYLPEYKVKELKDLLRHLELIKNELKGGEE